MCHVSRQTDRLTLNYCDDFLQTQKHSAQNDSYDAASDEDLDDELMKVNSH